MIDRNIWGVKFHSFPIYPQHKKCLGTPILKWAADKNRTRDPFLSIFGFDGLMFRWNWCWQAGWWRSQEPQRPQEYLRPDQHCHHGWWSLDTRHGGRQEASLCQHQQAGFNFDFNCNNNIICNPGAEETEAAPAALRVTTQWTSPHQGGQKYLKRLMSQVSERNEQWSEKMSFEK